MGEPNLDQFFVLDTFKYERAFEKILFEDDGGDEAILVNLKLSSCERRLSYIKGWVSVFEDLRCESEEWLEKLSKSSTVLISKLSLSPTVLCLLSGSGLLLICKLSKAASNESSRCKSKESTLFAC